LTPEIGKLTSHLGIFQEHLNKIAKTVYSSTGFPEDVYKIIIDYLPLFEVREENNVVGLDAGENRYHDG
jgi:hypothetical protein